MRLGLLDQRHESVDREADRDDAEEDEAGDRTALALGPLEDCEGESDEECYRHEHRGNPT